MTAPERPRPPVLALAWATLVAGATIGTVLWSHTEVASRLDDLAARVDAVESRLGLIRLEMDVTGKGVGALVEQIEVWAPELTKGTTPQPTFLKVRERLEDVLDAAETLGADAFDTFVGVLEGGSDHHDDDVRRWLVRAACRADPDRGKALASRIVRGTALQPSSRLRSLVADDLLQLDRELAGEVLAQVLQIESHNGRQRAPPAGLAPEYERVIGVQAFPDYINLIDKFAASDHPDREGVLRMLLGRAEHDALTYQKCIEHLGDLGSKAAVPRIKELYASPPGRFNPLFVAHCATAIAKIEGAAARQWLEQQLAATDQQLIAARLQALLKQYCP